MDTQRYDSKIAEPKWQEFWRQNGVYNFDENDLKRPVYSIDSPPPSISGSSIHMGHTFSYTQTDILARLKRMQGFNVFYSLGFDNNGMPTERFVEKLHDKKSKQLGRETFNKLCVEAMEKYQPMYRSIFDKLGFSYDHRYGYDTIGHDAQKISQAEFVKGYEKGQIYYNYLPSLFCVDCQSSVAQADLEDKESEKLFNYFNFDIEGSKEKLAIATTRPEMLAACVAVFVNPEDKRFKKYIGKKAVVPFFGQAVPILGDDKALMDKGTGVVMCCTFGDSVDLFWQQKHKLPIVNIINYDGTLNEKAGKYQGLYIKKARTQIIKDLLDAGLIYKQENITSSTSVHERCGTPIEIIPQKQWSIKIVDKKEDFIKQANKINWAPKSMLLRHNNWVNGIEYDWNISRQRHFGVSFPVWHCKDCGHIIVAKLEQLPVNPLETKCEACPNCKSSNVVPDTDVMDTWATSSICPILATYKIKNQEMLKKIHPMSMRPNAHDIIRTWDFYTIVRSYYANKQIPWENVVISGFILDGDGKKLSKSKGNAKIDPTGMVELYSSDVVRYWAGGSTLGVDTPLNEEQLKNGAKLVNKLFNAARFVATLVDGKATIKDCTHSIDKGFLAQFEITKKHFADYLSKYEIGLALGVLEKFFWHFCDDYIEIVKGRLYNNENRFGVAAQKSAQYTAYKLFFEMTKMFASHMPHITEEVYQSFFRQYEKRISIHSFVFDSVEKNIDTELIQETEKFCDVIATLRKYKSEKQMSMKDEIEFYEVKDSKFMLENTQDLKHVMNIKELKLKGK